VGSKLEIFFVATFSFLLALFGSVCQLVAELPNKRIVDKETTYLSSCPDVLDGNVAKNAWEGSPLFRELLFK